MPVIVAVDFSVTFETNGYCVLNLVTATVGFRNYVIRLDLHPQKR
jgi:hypothetical protein